jgi:hypothetical protein
MGIVEMPCDYKKYPPNWKELRAQVLKRAQNRCEKCGVENYSVLKKGSGRKPCPTDWDMIYSRIRHSHSNMTESLKYHGFKKIILTIAHLDHDEENHEVKIGRLKALCQRCHLRYDVEEKKRRRKSKKAVGDLFQEKTN